ncbi:MAG: glycosyltransferase family 4 protein [Chthoniobacteraceae bacterium]
MDDSIYGRRPLGIAVDLTPLRGGGVNGGIKPAIYAMLTEVGRIAGESIFFIFLTHSGTHGEVRALARPGDLLVCVEEDPACPVGLADPEREYRLPDPPPGLIKDIGADLLYAPAGGCGFAAEGVPTVATIVDLLHRDYPLTLTAQQIAEREASVIHTLATATRIQCISRNGMERLMHHYGVPEELLFFTYLPVQARLERARVDATTPPKAPPYFLYPANLWKHKNHEALLQAYRLYLGRAGDGAWDLVLTFHENARAGELRALAKALGIEAHVQFLGYVSDERLGGLWRNAGALVFPSLHEGFGIPLVEAMEYGVPILSSPDFSLREIGGDAALFIDPREPESIAAGMVRLAGDGPLRETLRHRGKRRLRCFDLGIETRKLIEAWRQCAASRYGFPRKPLALEGQAALSVATPSSDARWTLRVRVSGKFPQNRYRCYLGDAAFGAFTFEDHPEYAFDCRPLGRVLRVIVDRRAGCGDAPAEAGAAESIVAIEAVLAGNAEGDCIPLFSARKEDAL